MPMRYGEEISAARGVWRALRICSRRRLRRLTIMNTLPAAHARDLNYVGKRLNPPVPERVVISHTVS